jgi:hypothetical protein
VRLVGRRKIMTIFGKPVSAYFSLAKGLTIIVSVVGLLRLILSLAGAPNPATRWLSMSAVMWAGILYLAFRVHKSGFGSYRHLLPAVAIPNFASQIVSFIGIITAIAMGVDNVFTAPEAAFGGHGRNWLHAFSHPVLGGILGSLVYWLVSCVFLIVIRLARKDAAGAYTR